MPDLQHSLHKSDIGHLRIVAEHWGYELESKDVDSALEELCASLLDLEAVSETLDILQAPARSALTELTQANGKIEWAVFARKHGEIREMGAGKRDRERPHLKPTSTSENLFYRGLISKAFFETEKGLQEFAYIPDDLFEIIQEVGMQNENISLPKNEPLGRPATPVEKSFENLAADFILDDATTYLAALRINMEYVGARYIVPLLTTANIIKKNTPQVDAVKKFLETSRTEALDMLYKAWLKSETFDELRLLPGIICEG